MRVRPRAWVGVAVWVVYGLVVVVLQKSSGIPYTDFGDSPSNLWRGAVLSLVVGAVVLVAVTTWLGWWRPALRERRTTRARWTIIAPALLVVAVVGNLVSTTWSAVSLEFVLAALALGVFVGFTEELTTRGVLLVGLRGSVAEIGVALISSLCFGLMHGINIFLGQSVAATLPQIGQAFLHGLTFYILRRVTGSLIAAMALHGAWDFSVFSLEQAGGSNPLAILAIVSGVLALVFFWFAARDAQEAVEGREPDPAAATA
ncbi:CPBP family intramembrane glutamic endopeptidase [Cellulosimicrobium protaetiae]|uniref:CPBP family intramembrane metalloprotease n=1 Tax=Cellulosimicrobium protaetiae TaxID=2587808 RepID=A0A6M5UCG7_9MICO|nr:CPBP family intramembrane glutamic endopeptidase [Cellulosimicrobium protaetiae]QJW35041.1 CPBP family intramembrane metalloprotease [Cellulosimicrobium protaetiae]